MSPEQALAKEVDQRSDIFALGIIFYEMLSGRTPYQAQSAVASLILRTQQDVQPLCTLDSAVPESLSEIVCKCLERDVHLRYQSAAEPGLGSRHLRRWNLTHACSYCEAVFQAFTCPGKWIGASAAVLLLALTLGILYRSGTSHHRQRPTKGIHRTRRCARRLSSAKRFR